jgi:hypothetical protein
MRCLLVLATAVVLLSGAAAAAVAYTPLCGGANPACVYAYSTERQMVAGATTGIEVYRSVDATTQSIGFTRNGLTDTAAVQAFCNAAVSGVISRNCLLSTVYDQAYEAVDGRTGGCDITNATPSAMPTYLTWPAHSNLPQFQKGWQGTGTNFYLDTTGCTALTGGAQSLFYSGSNLYWSVVGGQAGLNENTPAPFPFGSMFSAYVGFGVKFGYCVITRYCGAFDTEGEGPQAPFTPTSNGDLIQVLATAGGRGPNNAWANNAQIVANGIVAHPLVTQGRMTWGATGDHKYNGPAINRSEAFYTSNLNSSQAAALYANEAAFQATLTLGYQGPGDLFGEYGTTPNVTNGHIGQMQYLAAAYTLRKPYAGYMGPLLNACQGQGPNSPCEDIGLSGNDIDTTTLSAFCGPASGLNNCTVQKWYNSALNQNATVAGGNSALDFTAVSTSARPTIAFSGCGTSKITVCIVTSPIHYFTGGGAISLYTGINGYALSAVAQRTGSFTTPSGIISSAIGAGPETFLGFGNTANTCLGAMHNGGGGPTLSTGCAENTIHSMTLDGATTPSIELYSDGNASTPTTTTLGFSAAGMGIGATSTGADSCTCQISEVLMFGDGGDTSFATALGAANVALLRANQQAEFGF